MPGNFKIINFTGLWRKLQVNIKIDIDNPATSHATHMIMIKRVAIKAFEGAAGFQLFDYARFGKYFEVSVYGTETDPWQSLTNHFVNFIGAGMGINLAQFFQDDFALPGHSKVGFF
jgi:hypothetical protein